MIGSQRATCQLIGGIEACLGSIGRYDGSLSTRSSYSGGYADRFDAATVAGRQLLLVRSVHAGWPNPGWNCYLPCAPSSEANRASSAIETRIRLVLASVLLERHSSVNVGA